MSILVVDDRVDSRELLESMLHDEGYKAVKTAASAEEAVGIVERANQAGADQQIELILMDITMPKINGIEACRIIKGKDYGKDIPIIMVTGEADLDSFQAAFAAGAMDYVTKPVRKIELLTRMSSALALKHEMDQRKLHEEELRIRNEKLEKALAEIKVLRGFIPICAVCKNVRNIQGMWQQMEAYLQEHSEAKFSHGICDNCFRERYPDAAKDLGKG